MEFASLISPEVTHWIRENQQANPSQLLLAGNKMGEAFPFREAVQQIAARQKARSKLPEWYARPELLFPPGLSVEQASSELTAIYKAQLLHTLNGGMLESLADLTGGMGVDCYYLSHACRNTLYLEAQSTLAALATHNFGVLGANIKVENQRAEDYLRQRTPARQWLYLDPARRDEQQRKLVSLHDCQPNAVELLDRLLVHSQKGFMLKASPMLDIKQSIRELQHQLSEIHVVALRQEVKELLFIGSPRPCPDPLIVATSLSPGHTDSFRFRLSEESEAQPSLALPQTYLYEPHSSLLKAGCFNLLSSRFGLNKLHAHSHLYTSDRLVNNFPGRLYELVYQGRPNKKALAQLLPQGANVSVRNYPQPAEDLAKKLRLKPHSQHTVFGTSLLNGKPTVLVGRLLEA